MSSRGSSGGGGEGGRAGAAGAGAPPAPGPTTTVKLPLKLADLPRGSMQEVKPNPDQPAAVLVVHVSLRTREEGDGGDRRASRPPATHPAGGAQTADGQVYATSSKCS